MMQRGGLTKKKRWSLYGEWSLRRFGSPFLASMVGLLQGLARSCNNYQPHNFNHPTIIAFRYSSLLNPQFSRGTKMQYTQACKQRNINDLLKPYKSNKITLSSMHQTLKVKQDDEKFILSNQDQKQGNYIIKIGIILTSHMKATKVYPQKLHKT